MTLDASTDLNLLATLESGLCDVGRAEPLDHVTLLSREREECCALVVAQILDARDGNVADDVLADLTDETGLVTSGYRNSVTAPMVSPATRASAVVPASIETAGVTLVIGRVRALDALEREDLVPIGTAPEEAVIDVVGETGLHIVEALGLTHVLAGREEREVAVAALTAA